MTAQTIIFKTQQHEKLFFWITLGFAFMIVVAGCVFEQEAKADDGTSTPTPIKDNSAIAFRATTPPEPATFASGMAANNLLNVAAQSCVHPAGWQTYTVRENETLDTLAWRFAVDAATVLAGNCFVSSAEVFAGRTLYVPPLQVSRSVETVLPLGINHFAASSTVVSPGGTITLEWAGQGAVRHVEIGWVYNGAYVREAAGLPSTGQVELTIPDDGRDHMTYLVRVTDGNPANEVIAQTSVQVQCEQAWYFTPAPSGCPSDLLLTTFREQHFERGTIVYMPALGMHYVMVAGQEARLLRDEFVPGMPLRDEGILIPDNFSYTDGAIHYTWRHDSIRTALGYAIDDEREYQGLMQRTVGESGELMYIMASSGHVYRVGTGLVWGVIIPE